MMTLASDLCKERRELTEAEIRTVLNAKKRDAKNRYRRKRWASDPEYRERMKLARSRRNAERNASRRQRYLTDPEYRQRCIERSRRNHARRRAHEG